MLLITRYTLLSAAGALLAGTPGCGGRVLEEPAPATEAPNAPSSAARPSPPRPPRRDPAPLPPVASQPVPAPPPPFNPVPRPSEGLPETQVENILAANCGQCHGPALRPEQASGDIWFIDDVDQLTERGYIVPLNSAASRIVQVMRDGSMPPADSGLPPLDESDIEIVARFIDEPRFWPVPPRPQPPEAIDAGVAPLPGDAG